MIISTHGISSSSGFGPSNLAGLKLWLKAHAGVTLNGSTVSNWADQSATGNHAVQSTSTDQPLLVLNALNGMPVIRFDGVNDFFNFTSNLNIAAPGVSIFFVVKKSASDKNLILFGNSIGLGYDTINHYFANNHFDFLFNYDSNGLVISIPTGMALTSYAQVAVMYNLINLKIFINKVDKGNANFTAPTTFNKIGKRGDGLIGSFDVAEIIQYDTVLSDANRTKVENYLSNKYAI